jgi:hypothetical protein
MSNRYRVREVSSAGRSGFRRMALRGSGPAHPLPHPLECNPRRAGRFHDLSQSILEIPTHLLWWSHGAFGSKGQLYGAQYLAGRRAPPLLRQ